MNNFIFSIRLFIKKKKTKSTTKTSKDWNCTLSYVLIILYLFLYNMFQYSIGCTVSWTKKKLLFFKTTYLLLSRPNKIVGRVLVASSFIRYRPSFTTINFFFLLCTVAINIGPNFVLFSHNFFIFSSLNSQQNEFQPSSSLCDWVGVEKKYFF